MPPAKWAPRPHQRPMMRFLMTHKRGNLFAGMGAGKSSCILQFIDWMLMGNVIRGRTLIITPLRVAETTFPEEIEKFHFPRIRMSLVLGDATERRRALRDKKANVFVINWDNIQWLEEELGEEFESYFEMAVADESTKLAGYRSRAGSKRAAALAKIAHKIPRWYNMTGTPGAGGLLSLWGQQWFIDGGRALGTSYKAFTQRYFWQEFADKYHVVLTPTALAEKEIREKMAATSVYIDPAEWFGTDKPVVNDIWVKLPKKAQAVYDQVEAELFAELESGDIEARNAAGRSNKCLQIAGGACYLTDANGDSTDVWEEIHGAKLDALEQIIEEANGEPVLVAYNFRHEKERILKRFKQARELDKKAIADWNKGKVPVMVAHPASAGHGLNLQDGGRIMVYYSTGWNLEHTLQILERIGPVRQMQAGHPRTVFVHRIIARGTVDAVVMRRSDKKQGVMQSLLDYWRHKKSA